jgi:tRNA threonylcarbamoyladenosine modification (KEOPS) complex  Pcc1 subunit
MNHNDITGSAVLEIPMESTEVATILYQALLPETESIPSDRASSKVSVKNSTLLVEVEANDLTALRASLNSFSAWIAACLATLESIEKS